MTGTVLSHNGKPLAGAEIYLATNVFTINECKAFYSTLLDARMAMTEKSGKFDLASEVEPYYLVVLHDQGYAVLTEAEVASIAIIRIKPWTADDRGFRLERRPFTGTTHSWATD